MFSEIVASVAGCTGGLRLEEIGGLAKVSGKAGLCRQAPLFAGGVFQHQKFASIFLSLFLLQIKKFTRSCHDGH